MTEIERVEINRVENGWTVKTRDADEHHKTFVYRDEYDLIIKLATIFNPTDLWTREPRDSDG